MSRSAEASKSLRSHLQRIFFVSFLVVSAASLAVVSQLSARSLSRNEATYYTGLSGVLSDLVKHSLELSDYSDAQRMLSLISKAKRITPAILTEEGDFLFGDYDQARASGLPSLPEKKHLTCAKIAAYPPAPDSKLFCTDIIGLAEGLGGRQDHLGLSLILLDKKSGEFPFWPSFWVFGCLVLSLFALAWGTRFYFVKLIVVPMELLRKWVLEKKANPLSPLSDAGPPFNIRELTDLKAAFGELFETVQRESLKRQESERQLAMQNLARQVAHDIRSPLSALDAAIQNLGSVPEESRLLIRGASQRIHDIANNLLSATRNDGARPESALAAEATLIAPVIESIISEKRLQLTASPGIAISWDAGDLAYGLFAQVNAVELKRMLSNLINNAVEALDREGSISIRLENFGSQFAIHISDDGPGMPAAALARLGERGNTVGKPDGSGLGLHHAQGRTLEWGGNLEVKSLPGKGTDVIIRLPKTTPPSWFLPSVELCEGTVVVVLDDDENVHNLWNSRFDLARARERGVQILHFSTPDALRKWTGGDPAAARAVYLMDYELAGFRETGLDLADELRLTGRAILVTSRFEEKIIVEGCTRRKMRLIPKSQVRLAPISMVSSAPTLDAVLIDDDPLVRKTWEVSAQRQGKKLRTFESPEGFAAISREIDRAVPVYVDSRLQDDVRGEEFARTLREQGFLRLFLCTGQAPESFGPMPWITEIVGKTPPWDGAPSAS